MERGCGTVVSCYRGHHGFAEPWMVELGRFRPVDVQELRRYVDSNETIHSAVDTLLFLWVTQNQEIHELALRCGDISQMTFARRELLWFRRRGQEAFFQREDIVQEVAFLSSLSSDEFMEAWNDLQMLLFGVHLCYLAHVLGRIPTDEECERWSGELRKWFRRMAVRFMPIRMKMLH